MWYRSRTVYKKLLAALQIICCAFLIVFCVLSIVLPKDTVSETEKRELAQKPAFSLAALLDGSYMRDYELYYADTFPLREKFVRFASKVEDAYGVRYDDVRIVGGTTQSEENEKSVSTSQSTTAYTTVESRQSSQTQTSITQTEPPQTTHSQTQTEQTTTTSEQQGQKVEGVFIYGDRAFELFGGSQNQKYAYAEAVSVYADKFPKARVYNMVIPTSIAFYLPEKYRDYSADEKNNIDSIYGALSEKVKAIDVYSVLEKHKAEYIYFNTDHHWTGLGAYYAYAEFAQAAGFTPYAYADYEKSVIEDFLGTLAISTNDAKLLNNPDIVEYCYPPVDSYTLRWSKTEAEPEESTIYAEYAKWSNAYSVYLHGDWPRTDIINEEATNDRCVLIVKESYGNAFVPYLVPHYARVVVIDERYYTESIENVVNQEGVDDIIVINNVFAANTKSTTTKLNGFIGE